MSESTPTETARNSESHELETLADVLGALVGKVVTVANPESYEDAPVGHRLTTGFYRAKVVAVKQDHVVLITEFKHVAGHGSSEPTKQFVPLSRIKRISIMKSEKVLHI